MTSELLDVFDREGDALREVDKLSEGVSPFAPTDYYYRKWVGGGQWGVYKERITTKPTVVETYPKDRKSAAVYMSAGLNMKQNPFLFGTVPTFEYYVGKHKDGWAVFRELMEPPTEKRKRANAKYEPIEF